MHKSTQAATEQLRDYTSLALWDFDGTLIDTDSFILVARAICPVRKLIRAAIKSLPWIVAWKLKIIDSGRAKEHLFGFLYKGMTDADFKTACAAQAVALYAHAIPEAMNSLRRQLDNGSRVIVVSASIDSWVKPCVALMGISEVVSTVAATDGNEVLTGKFATPNCNGPEKVRRVKEYIGNDWDKYTNIEVHGDSHGDDAMMALATGAGSRHH